MKEGILDVLLYLFEHYFYDEPDAVRDRDSLQKTLIQAGFAPADIHRAFDWLDGIAREPLPAGAASGRALRVFVEPEMERLDAAARGLLISLESRGVLDAEQRELVLERALALEQDELDADDLKWVVLMVLFHRPGAEAACAWIENQMFDEPEPLH
jgi:Smg protein